MHVFIGYDPRQPLSANVARSSVERHASRSVAFTSLILRQLPIERQGATEFSFSRFLVPYLCNYEGYAIFMDEDMVVTGDVYELEQYITGEHPVYVVKDQPGFEWPSFMLFDCAKCKTLTPEYIEDTENKLYDMKWAESVGDLPKEWNHCVGITEPRTDAKLYHYTQGIPYWPECRGLPEDRFWFEEYDAMLESVDWIDLHRNTVHFGPVIERFLSKYGIRANFSRRT